MGQGWSDDGTVPVELALAVMQHMTWQDRARVLLVNRYFGSLAQSESFWQWMSMQLTLDYVFVPSVPFKGSWRETFQAFYPMRKRWRTLLGVGLDDRHAFQIADEGDALPAEDGDLGAEDPDALAAEVEEAAEAEEASNRYSINVSVRFRPSKLPKKSRSPDAGAEGDEQGDSSEDGEDKENEEVRAIIPLHQRLQMIQIQHRCSPSTARKMLWARSSNTFDPWASAVVTDPHAIQTIHTEGHAEKTPAFEAAVPTDKEASVTADESARAAADSLPSTIKVGVLSVQPATRKVLLCAPSVGLREFRFDSVHADSSGQEDVYKNSACQIVADFMNGTNGCFICFGQTGTGKTFTMFGPDERSSTFVRAVLPRSGLVPRTLAEVLSALTKRRAVGLQCELKMSYVEVFGDEVTDLLNNSTPVGAWHGMAARMVLNGEVAVPLDTPYEAEELLIRAERSKRRAATAMNERSSRAHSVIILTLEQRMPGSNAVVSRLCMADLGGSEQLKKSKAEGERQREAVQINMGLLALKNVISSLNRRRRHIPFHNSTLTMILQAGLGGNAKTSVIVTGSMEAKHTYETLQSMRFGEQCRRIENVEALHILSATSAIDALNKEIEELEAKIKATERWENVLVKRKDVEGEETIIKSVLVGAEDLRVRYESLLATRMELVGV